MGRTRSIIVVILAIVGFVWIGQGLGLVRGGSFMVDDTRWAAIGAACLVAALLIGLRSPGRWRGQG